MINKTPLLAFFLGLGYSASFLARHLITLGWRIAGTSQKRLVDQAIYYNLEEIQVIEADLVVVSIPPEANHLFKGIKISTKWGCYLSSTGVYAPFNGTVNEGSATLPGERLEAEDSWLERGFNVLRLGGIYGPQRNALTRLQENKSFLIDQDAIFNRIHVLDIAQAIMKTAARKSEIFNCVDDHPSYHNEVVEYACKILKCPLPKVLSRSNLSPEMQGYFARSKIVSNKKLKGELGINLLYPSYKEGLLAC